MGLPVTRLHCRAAAAHSSLSSDACKSTLRSSSLCSSERKMTGSMPPGASTRTATPSNSLKGNLTRICTPRTERLKFDAVARDF
jgi:hypothetical protein